MNQSQQRQQKKNDIVEAAAMVFAAKGFNNTLMADVAAKAKIGKGTIYEYFNSKDELFFAVFEWFMSNTMDMARVGLGDLAGGVDQRLAAVVGSMARVFEQSREFFALFLEFWSTAASLESHARIKQSFDQAYVEMRAMFAAMINQGAADGHFRSGLDAEAVAAGLVGGLDGIFLQCWLDPKLQAVPLAKAFSDTMLRGLMASKG